MSWVGCLLKDSELFILFAENSQIILKIFLTTIFLTFIYLVALNLLANNQLNSSMWHIIVAQVALYIARLFVISYRFLDFLEYANFSIFF